MMVHIILFTNNPQIKALYAQEFPAFEDLHLVTDIPATGTEKILTAIAAYQAEIVIARGSRADHIRSLNLPLTVVDVPVTAFDLIQALEKAKAYGRRLAVVGVSHLIFGVERLGSLLDVEILPYPIDAGADLGDVAEKVRKGKAKAVVGGYSAIYKFFSQTLPVISIGTHAESIRHAVAEARRIAAAGIREKMQNSLTKAFLDNTHHGVVAVDSDNRIMACNIAAQHMLKTSDHAVLGKNVREVWPELDLTETLRSQQEEKDLILDCNGVAIVCDKSAVTLDARSVAALATFQEVSHIVQREASVRRMNAETGLFATGTFAAISARSQAMQHAVATAKRFALTDSSVMLLGETGTGKELFAQSIHNHSARNKGPFLAINCAALPPDLLESELFGYEAGAFTGASAKGKPGMFELAHGGTLLLDEFGEMALATQGKFLRALQERKVMRLGGGKLIPVDIRVITATNRDLSELIARNAFRADLYYRLNVLRIHLPPLRDCPEDIVQLARRLCDARTGPKQSICFTPTAIKMLQRHPWPGNVRELQNLVERLAALYPHGHIGTDEIDALLAEETRPTASFIPQPDLEREEISKALIQARGNYTQAAYILGISRVTLWRRMRNYRDLAEMIKRRRG